MFWKKKEPEKYWTKFQWLDQCAECCHLQEGIPFRGVCPNCGSQSINKVVGRWLYSVGGCTRKNHKSEIRAT